jgi:hypothetical protein
VYYIPVIKDQNEGKPVMFKLITQKDYPVNGKMASFSNPDHDFPQFVTYELKGDSMLAEISGKKDGKDMAEKFPMIKAK